jgi:hypothetical protein
MGKFHGVIAATTPSGVRCMTIFVLSVSFNTSTGRSIAAKARRVVDVDQGLPTTTAVALKGFVGGGVAGALGPRMKADSWPSST